MIRVETYHGYYSKFGKPKNIRIVDVEYLEGMADVSKAFIQDRLSIVHKDHVLVYEKSREGHCKLLFKVYSIDVH